MSYNLLPGDVLDVVSSLPDNTYSAVFCDPPYGIKFMNKRWDHGVPSVAVWEQVYRVCKPGAVLMAFGGTRTWHRLAVNIEDAGWQMFDTLMYVYGSGFPKGHDISKAIDKAAGAEREVVGYRKDLSHIERGDSNYLGRKRGIASTFVAGTTHSITAPATPEAATWAGYNVALKPSYEPILCFRKPLESTYAHSALTYGTAALNIDGCRVPIGDGDQKGEGGRITDIAAKNGKIPYDGGIKHTYGQSDNVGRWPANLIHSGDAEVMEVFDRAGVRRSAGDYPTTYVTKNNNNVYGNGVGNTQGKLYDDTGSAARFFYCAKASSSERNAGLDGDNPHPTLKPLSLCEYIARLIVPPEAYRDDAKLLIPYSGSGSEAIGAMQAGWRNITGIELDAEYCEINRRRFDHWAKQAQTVQPALLEVA